FKLQLGIPINLPLVLDDSLARPITSQYDRYYKVLADADAANKLIEKQRDLPPAQLRPFLRRIFTEDPLVRGTEFRTKLPPQWEKVAKASAEYLKDRLDRMQKERTKLLNLKTDLELKGENLSPEQTAALLANDFESDLIVLEQRLRLYEARPWLKLK